MINVNLKLTGKLEQYVKSVSSRDGDSSYASAARKCINIAMEREKERNGNNLPMFKKT